MTMMLNKEPRLRLMQVMLMSKKKEERKHQKVFKRRKWLTIRTTKRQSMGPQSQWQVKATRKARNRPRHQLKSNARSHSANSGTKRICRQCENLDRAKANDLPEPKKRHEDWCPNSHKYKDRVNELRTLLEDEGSLEPDSEDFKESFARIKHLQRLLGQPYDSTSDRAELRAIVGKGPWKKIKKQKRIVKANKSHRAYKGQVESKFPSTSHLASVFFFQGKAEAAQKVHKMKEQEWLEKNATKKAAREAAAAVEREKKQAEIRRAAEARKEAQEKEAAELFAKEKAAATSHVSPRPQEEELNATNALKPSKPSPPGAASSRQQVAAIRNLGPGLAQADALEVLLLEEIAKPAKTASVGKAPKPVTAMFSILLAHLPKRWCANNNDLKGGAPNKAAMQWHKDNFRNELYFRVPRLSLDKKPSPEYHSLTGLRLFVLQWELIIPGLEIKCPRPGCSGVLVHERQEFSKNRKAVPLFGMDGSIDWTIEMKYKCSTKECTCKSISASSPLLTANLPPALSLMYPVDPRFVKPNCHLTKSVTQWLRSTTITYLSADAFAKFLYEAINVGYVDEVWSYVQLWLSNGADDDSGNNIPEYPNQYVRQGAFPPSGAVLREMMSEMEQSKQTVTGVSDHDRHRRELTSVVCKLAFSFDHLLRYC